MSDEKQIEELQRAIEKMIRIRHFLKTNLNTLEEEIDQTLARVRYILDSIGGNVSDEFQDEDDAVFIPAPHSLPSHHYLDESDEEFKKELCDLEDDDPGKYERQMEYLRQKWLSNPEKTKKDDDGLDLNI